MIAAEAVVCHLEICENFCIFNRRAGEWHRGLFRVTSASNLCDILYRNTCEQSRLRLHGAGLPVF